MNGSMAMLADLLEKNAGSRRSRRSKSSSRSRSSSARDQRGKRRSRSKLRELSKYKEETEAMKKAEQEKEKQVQEKFDLIRFSPSSLYPYFVYITLPFVVRPSLAVVVFLTTVETPNMFIFQLCSCSLV